MQKQIKIEAKNHGNLEMEKHAEKGTWQEKGRRILRE